MSHKIMAVTHSSSELRYGTGITYAMTVPVNNGVVVLSYGTCTMPVQLSKDLSTFLTFYSRIHVEEETAFPVNSRVL